MKRNITENITNQQTENHTYIKITQKHNSDI